jgi:hypothetical protein
MAQPIATHYDNLKVAHDAPVDVIKRAYRKLSQKYHPDRNPDPSALEIMKMINLAWDVLSDPERRARHDRAIASVAHRSARVPAAPVRPSSATTSARAAPAEVKSHADGVRVSVVIALLLAVVLFAVFQFSETDTDTEDAALPAQAMTEEIAPPATASERMEHGYLRSAAQDQSPGIGVVDIDNTGALHDAEVRLFVNSRAARSMYVHHGKRFVVDNLAPGKYVVKYKIEVDGKMHAYQERATFQAQRDKFSKLKITLPDAADEIRLDQF